MHASLREFSPRVRARFLATMVAGGIRGADGDDETEAPFADRLDALYELLSDGEARGNLTDAEIGWLSEQANAMYASVRANEVDGISAYDTEVLRRLGDCLIVLAGDAASRYTEAEAAMTRIAQIEAEAGISPAAAVEDEVDPAADPAAVADPADPPADPVVDPALAVDPPADPATPATPAAPVRRMPGLAELRGRAPRQAIDPADLVNRDPEGASVRWVPTGETIDRAEFIRRVANYGDTMSSGVPMGMKAVLGQIDTTHEGGVTINSRTDSPELVSEKLALAVRGGMDPSNWRAGSEPSDELLASGGWGAPSPVAYDVDTLAVADRPVDAALPSATVDRGGLTWVRQPNFSDIVTGGPTVTGAAVGIWTAATDATPNATVKSKQVVGSPTTRTVQLDALYMQLQNGVLQSRAYPEWVAAWERHTEAAWARMAETYLMDKIEDSTITKLVTQANVVGATRDYLAFVSQLAAGERNRQRMRPDAMVRALYPSKLVDIVVIDLLRAGTSFGDQAPQVVARNYLDGQLRAANINASQYMDSSTAGGQLVAAQADETNLRTLGTNIRSYVFHEGMFVVGKGGTLDLGIVRDADLVNTNDFRTFSESFESLFDRGHWAYTLDTVVCPSGQAAGFQDLEHFCTTGS